MEHSELKHIKLNRESWNKRTALHVESDFYRHEAFLAGATSLKEIELALLGDIRGKEILHLQCHFGQDSISLARMGAKVTAVDLSPVAIELAKKTTKDLGIEVEFICSDVLTPELLKGRSFDLIYASYGTICWLPDLKPWAQLIHDKLKPLARLLLVDFHPMLDMFDDDMQRLTYSYFNTQPVIGSTQGSYAQETQEEIPYIVWNHPISDILSPLLDIGLKIDQFKEYPYSPYPCFAGTKSIAKDRYVIKEFDDKLPMCYSLIATKP